MAGEQSDRTALERRLRASRRLLVFVLVALGFAAVLANAQRVWSERTQQQLLTATVADRFIELAVRARLLAQFDPTVVAHGDLIADGLFDGQAVRASWDAPIRINLTVHVGDPSVLVLEVAGLPRQPCPAFASRVLQRAVRAGAHGVRVNGIMHVVRPHDSDQSDARIESCAPDNAVALIIAIPRPSDMPEPPVVLSV